MLNCHFHRLPHIHNISFGRTQPEPYRIQSDILLPSAPHSFPGSGRKPCHPIHRKLPLLPWLLNTVSSCSHSLSDLTDIIPSASGPDFAVLIHQKTFAIFQSHIDGKGIPAGTGFMFVRIIGNHFKNHHGFLPRSFVSKPPPPVLYSMISVTFCCVLDLGTQLTFIFTQ
nr:MAG TPA: hypothetical protein [Caudoviricetes sp.]